MEQVGFTAVFEVNKALQNMDVFKNTFNKIGQVSGKVADVMQQGYNKIGNKTDETKKKIKELNESSVGKNLNAGMEKMSSFMVAKGMLMAQAISGAFSSVVNSVKEFYPAIDQTFTMAKNVMMANFVSPIAKDLTPVLVKFMKMIADNRDVFIRLGRLVVETVKFIVNVVKGLFNSLTKSWSGMWATINGGKKSINNLFMFINMIIFKVGFVFALIQIRLETILEAIGSALKFLFTNVLSPYIEGFRKGFGEGIGKVIDNVLEGLDSLIEAFSFLKGTGDKEIKPMQDLFRSLGYWIGRAVLLPLQTATFIFKTFAKVIKEVITIIRDPLSFVELIFDTVGSKLSELSRYFKQLTGEFLDAIVNSFLKIRKHFLDWIKMVKEFILKWKDLFMNNSMVRGFVDRIVNIFERLWTKLKLFGTNIKKSLTDMFDIKAIKGIASFMKRFQTFSSSLVSTNQQLSKTPPPGGTGGGGTPTQTQREIVEVSTGFSARRNSFFEIRNNQSHPLGNSSSYKKQPGDDITKIDEGDTYKGLKFRDGGIARGSESGYPVTLHGTEAVIPLKGGNIPLIIKGNKGAVYNDNRNITINVSSTQPNEVRREIETTLSEAPYKDDFLKGLIKE